MCTRNKAAKIRRRELQSGEWGRGFLRQDGVPRGAYRGTVQVTMNGGRSRVFITPAPDFRPTVEPGFGVDRNGGAPPTPLSTSLAVTAWPLAADIQPQHSEPVCTKFHMHAVLSHQSRIQQAVESFTGRHAVLP